MAQMFVKKEGFWMTLVARTLNATLEKSLWERAFSPQLQLP